MCVYLEHKPKINQNFNKILELSTIHGLVSSFLIVLYVKNRRTLCSKKSDQKQDNFNSFGAKFSKIFWLLDSNSKNNQSLKKKFNQRNIHVENPMFCTPREDRSIPIMRKSVSRQKKEHHCAMNLKCLHIRICYHSIMVGIRTFFDFTKIIVIIFN